MSKFKVGDRVVQHRMVSLGGNIRSWSGVVVMVNDYDVYVKADIGVSWIDSEECDLVHEELLNSPLWKAFDD